MRSKVVRTLALALLLCGVGVGLAQQQGKKQVRSGDVDINAPAKQKAAAKKSKLEEMLAEALRNNADIRVATAKLAEADAELNRTRVQVTQQVVTLHQAILSQKAMVDLAQKKYARYKGLRDNNAIDERLVDEELGKLTVAKAKLAELEAQIPGLLGRVARSESNAEAREYEYEGTIDLARAYREFSRRALLETRRRATGPLAERMRKALQTSVKVDYKDMPVSEVFKDLEKKAPGLSFRIRGGVYRGGNLTLHFDMPLPIPTLLQAIHDEVGCRFFVRDYGILVTQVVVPDDAMTVKEFLRQKPAEESRRQPIGRKNPPAENVEGVVKNTDPSGLMTITIGSDAGLAKGHTLELFRLNAASPTKSKYLGTIRILETKEKEAVAQPIGRLDAPPQNGDRVASRIPGK